MTKNQVQVSIYCLTYNHEKYIRQCLDGFVMQKEVTFEIVIHDDASTDKTAEIIREYAEKYPNLFKPIYQTKNHRYFPHINYAKEYMAPLLNGKYIAMCEGDDYWTDPYKLKKQYEALEKNPDCYLCLHNVDIVDENGLPIEKSFSLFTALGLPPEKHYPLCTIPTGKLLSENFFDIYEKADYYQTSSCFFVTEKYIEYISNPPEFRQVSPVFDEPRLLYFSYIGNVYYINETMSKYRFQSQDSWSSMLYGKDQNTDSFVKRKNYIAQMRKMLCSFSAFSNRKYDSKLMFWYDKLDRMELRLKKDILWYCIKKKNYKLFFSEFSVKELLGRGFYYKTIIKTIKMKLSHLLFSKKH